jgi:hypothetical protein
MLTIDKIIIQQVTSDTGLTKVARDAYAATANKASLGTPSQFWIQRFIDKVTVTTLSLYPIQLLQVII